MSCSPRPAAERPLDSRSNSRLVAAVLTPRGRGAIATVLVSGPAAAATVAQLFSPASAHDISAAAIGRILFGRWGTSGEELVVCRRAEDQIEVHCHGGDAAVQAVLASLVDVGCHVVSWTAAVDQQRRDSISALALKSLARATTLRTAAILLDQYHGALKRELDECARLLDSSDSESCLAGVIRLQTLCLRSRLGRHLVEPFRVVLAGKPNVGKSSLINALVGYQRSIVYHQPGTTRDVVSVATALAGWPVELSDTAGLRSTVDELEHAGVQLALEKLSAADLRLLVFDASQPWQNDDEALVKQWPDALVVFNKIDLATHAPVLSGAIATSALTGLGIEELARGIGDRLVPDPPPAGAAVPFHESHEQAISTALALCNAGQWSQAARLLGSATLGPTEK
jgi:tRNA modification GTPase